MIYIKNGGGYSSDIMTVKVPIKKAKDEFAMGFFYNEKTQTLEGLPLIEATDSTVTIATRNFAPSSVSLGKRLFKGSSDPIGNLIIASIKESQLLGQTIISSGFTPGIDDWEFVNHGSYIAPGGHCAGQTISAMWYYYEKKSAIGNLFHRYDKVNKSANVLWEDNPLGYRFASVVQSDVNWDNLLRIVLRKLAINQKQTVDNMTWKELAFAMLITGEPQYLGIAFENGIDGVTGDKLYAGHAIIAYKISMTNGTIYIADPNKPGDGARTVSYNGTFSPYVAATKDGNPVLQFPYIAYYPKSALIDWDKIGQRWSEFENGTIGNDKFPAYTLWVEDGVGYELTDGLNTDADSITFHCYSAGCNGSFSGTDHYQFVKVYNDDGNFVGQADITGRVGLKLEPGANTFGIYITGGLGTDWEYLDFKWINVYYESGGITPHYFFGGPNVEYTWMMSLSSPPTSTRYEWNFGDGTSVSIIRNNAYAKHTYTSTGSYNITLDIYNDSNNQLAGADTAEVQIVNSFYFIISKKDDSQRLGTMSDGSELPSLGNGLMYPIRNITWSNDSFSGTDSYSSKLGGYIKYEPTFNCSGRIDYARNVISTLEYTDVKNMYDVDTGDLVGTSNTRIVFANIPLHGSSSASMPDSTLKNYITTIEHSYPGSSGTVTLQSMNWANTTFLLSFQ
jgi:hypothetical protein